MNREIRVQAPGTKEPAHVDDFIEDYRTDAYASFVLNYFRMSATLRIKIAAYMKGHLLFCTREGTRYRVTGASRLGDVWLAKDYARDAGYDLRVDIGTCSGWGPKP
jgi:hypothetical protein